MQHGQALSLEIGVIIHMNR